MGTTAHPCPRRFPPAFVMLCRIVVVVVIGSGGVVVCVVPCLRYVMLRCRDVAMQSSTVIGSGGVVGSGRVVGGQW